MCLELQATSRFKNKKQEIIVRQIPKVVSTKGKDVSGDKGENSLVSYVLYRTMIPLILTFLLATMKDGLPFIIIMWVTVIAVNICNYREMYPQDRPATQEEIELYHLLKKKEALQIWHDYSHRLINYDIYGAHKDTHREFSDGVAVWLGIYPEKHSKTIVYSKDIDIPQNIKDKMPAYFEREREKELSRRKEFEDQLEIIEKTYGSTWKDDFRKELEENGIY